ncbi:MAG TPA: hypoxanthine-guanine phosphoribosyltransferase [Pseudomonadales bacterium]|nr:hypoxanthine-guanine phosphoribosyltransferase [Pseudomonadales bacterium]
MNDKPSIEHINQVWQEADCLFTNDQVEAAIDNVAKAMTEKFADENPLFVCVMTGGVIFYSKLLLKLGFPLEMDYMQVSRYRNNTQGGHLEWKVRPNKSLQGRVVVLVDDIFDEGYTLEAIVKEVEQMGVKALYTAVLVDKIHDRKCDPNFKMDFVGLEAADRYLFGYGMDYKGYLRNAPGIYAVKGL